MYTAILSDTKLTDQFGGTDVYVEFSDGTNTLPQAFHFATPPSPADVSAVVQPVLDGLNASDATAAKLAVLSAAKGMAIQSATPTAGLSKLAFRALFTLPELIKLDNFATNDALSDEQKKTVTTIMANYTAAQNITLTDAATQQGLGYLASIGLISPDRMAQILAGATVGV